MKKSGLSIYQSGLCCFISSAVLTICDQACLQFIFFLCCILISITLVDWIMTLYYKQIFLDYTQSMLMGKQFYSVPFTTSKLVSSLPYKCSKLDERLSSHFCLQLKHLPVLPYSSTYLSLKKCFKSMIIFSWKIFTHAW